MPDTSIPGLSTPTTPAPPAPGLINAAPGSTTQTPGQTPAGGTVGAPVTSYTPAQADATKATAVGSTPAPFTVAPDQTVSGQIKNIIASGSPLMEQAETNAKNLMNQRGLINSSTALTADQSALYSAAAPIAGADAATYAKAASDTTTAQNAALAAQAAAQNTASGTNAQLGTAVSQGNATAANTAMGQAATASNTVAQTAQQIAGSKDIAELQGHVSTAIATLQANTSMSNQDKQDATSQIIANIQSNTTLSAQDKQDATQQAIQASQAMTQKYLGELQANTTLTAQDKAAAAQAALAAANNLSAQAIAHIQADTSLSIEQQQTASAQIIAGMNNTNAQTVQYMVNAGNLATIQANGAINEQITTMTNTNKTLLQTSSAAASIYSQTLANMASILTNKDLSADQKTSALNSSVAGLNDALKTIGNIANNQAIGSTLTFDSSSVGGGTITLPDGTTIPTGTANAANAPPGWNEQQYLANNPDVVTALKDPAWAGKTALDHYLMFGKSEGRSFAAPPATGGTTTGGTTTGATSPPAATGLTVNTAGIPTNSPMNNGVIDTYGGLPGGQAQFDALRREAGFKDSFGNGSFETWLGNAPRDTQVAYINSLIDAKADPDLIRTEIAKLKPS